MQMCNVTACAHLHLKYKLKCKQTQLNIYGSLQPGILTGIKWNRSMSLLFVGQTSILKTHMKKLTFTLVYTTRENIKEMHYFLATLAQVETSCHHSLNETLF